MLETWDLSQMTTFLTNYDFLLEFFLLVVIICVIVLVTKLKRSKLNADSLAKDILDLRDQLQKVKESTDTRQTDLCKTVLGLEEALASGNVDAKKSVQIKMDDNTFLHNPQSIELLDTTNDSVSYNRSASVAAVDLYQKPLEFVASKTFLPCNT